MEDGLKVTDGREGRKEQLEGCDLVVVMPYGGEVEDGAGEPSYYSDVCCSSVDGGEGGAMSPIHVRLSLLPLSGLWRNLMF